MAVISSESTQTGVVFRALAIFLKTFLLTTVFNISIDECRISKKRLSTLL